MSKQPFKDIEKDGRFRHSCIYWKKISPLEAILISDDKYEADLAQFIPYHQGTATFEPDIEVELVSGELLTDTYLDRIDN